MEELRFSDLVILLGWIGGFCSFFVMLSVFLDWVENLIKGFIQRKKTHKK